MKGGHIMEIYVGKHTPLTEAESLYDKMWDDFFGDRKIRVRNRRERAKQDKLRSKTYLRIIAEIKPDAELVALNDWLKYA